MARLTPRPRRSPNAIATEMRDRARELAALLETDVKIGDPRDLLSALDWTALSLTRMLHELGEAYRPARPDVADHLVDASSDAMRLHKRIKGANTVADPSDPL